MNDAESWVDSRQIATTLIIFAATAILSGLGYTAYAVWGAGGKVDQAASTDECPEKCLEQCPEPCTKKVDNLRGRVDTLEGIDHCGDKCKSRLNEITKKLAFIQAMLTDLMNQRSGGEHGMVYPYSWYYRADGVRYTRVARASWGGRPKDGDLGRDSSLGVGIDPLNDVAKFRQPIRDRGVRN